MSYAIKGRCGLTAQRPVEYAVKLGQLAEALHISRHQLTARSLLVGLDIAADQIRAEQAAKAAQQPAAAVKE